MLENEYFGVNLAGLASQPEPVALSSLVTATTLVKHAPKAGIPAPAIH